MPRKACKELLTLPTPHTILIDRIQFAGLFQFHVESTILPELHFNIFRKYQILIHKTEFIKVTKGRTHYFCATIQPQLNPNTEKTASKLHSNLKWKAKVEIVRYYFDSFGHVRQLR